MEENLLKTGEEFSHWAIIQLMGHVTYSGFVENHTVFGKPMVRLLVPDTTDHGGIPGFVKLISPSAIYDITPVEKEFATKMAAKLRKAPMEDYNFNTVITDMAKEYVRKMSAKEVAQILLMNNGKPQKLEEQY